MATRNFADDYGKALTADALEEDDREVYAELWSKNQHLTEEGHQLLLARVAHTLSSSRARKRRAHRSTDLLPPSRTMMADHEFRLEGDDYEIPRGDLELHRRAREYARLHDMNYEEAFIGLAEGHLS